MRKFFRFILPLILVVLAIAVVVVMVTIAKGKRPERTETAGQAVRVDAIIQRVCKNTHPVRPNDGGGSCPVDLLPLCIS